jgi:histidyl-tRNA synthetase
LIAYFEAHHDQLDEEARRRLHTNPLRILDTKNPAMQALAEGAPRLIDFLGPESLAHFQGLQGILKSQNIPFKINPRLVRGLDYYNLSVFEWICNGLTVCGGGRYDPLIEMLGGKPAPGVGFAIGVERILELMRARAIALPSVDVYVVHQGEAAASAALQCAERLRDSAISVQMHAGGGSFKSQMKRADGSGAAYAIILGDQEMAEGRATVKALRANPSSAPANDSRPSASEQQWSVPLDQVAESLRDKMLGR